MDWTDYCYSNRARFKKVVKTNFKRINEIYPLKQKDVAVLYKALLGFPNLKNITVIGSSTTLKCNRDSDLDLVIELEKYDNQTRLAVIDEIEKALGCDYTYDVLWRDHLSEKDAIFKYYKQGVSLYE